MSNQKERKKGISSKSLVWPVMSCQATKRIILKTDNKGQQNPKVKCFRPAPTQKVVQHHHSVIMYSLPHASKNPHGSVQQNPASAYTPVTLLLSMA